MMLVINFIHTYVPIQKIRHFLTKKGFGAGNLIASSFGALTPFCSCSSLPVFLSFVKAGVPLGITLSFLITSPILNEYLIVIMFGIFGWKITLAYILAGILIGTIGGMVIHKLNLEHLIIKDMKGKSISDKEFRTIKSRLKASLKETLSIVGKLWIWILVAVALGAIIHNFVPEESVHNIISKGGIFTVPLAVILGVPIYGSCAAVVPIALALFQKGVPLGTALAFMMAISALSLPQLIIIRRAMKLKLIAIFYGIVIISMIVIGYMINFLTPYLV